VDPTTSPLSERTRAADLYTPSGAIPQRRTREYDPEYENDVKRRRVEDDPHERRSSPDRHSTLSPMVDIPATQLPSSESQGAYNIFTIPGGV
jgi:hypothetical protein